MNHVEELWVEKIKLFSKIGKVRRTPSAVRGVATLENMVVGLVGSMTVRAAVIESVLACM